jgi:hypothetical protein
MLPSDWEEYVVRLEREVASRPTTAPKRPRTTGRLVSQRQKIALSQSRNLIKASYQLESTWNQTPVIDPTETKFTTQLGGSCEPTQPHGKATQTRRPGAYGT